MSKVTIDSRNPIPAISLSTRLLYSSGVVGYALKDAAMAAFILFYYKQVLGLSGTLTGLAIAISIVWDGISDPLVGAWSDKIRTAIGRRHPFMIVSVAPLGVAFILLFSPPEAALETQASLFTWLLLSILLLRTALTVFMVPYLALGAEITTDYHERTRLASARTNLGYFVGVLVSATALALLFNDKNGVDGRFVIENYHLYGWVSAILTLTFSITCIAGTWRHIPYLAKATVHKGSNILRDLITAFRNRNFLYLVIFDTALGGMGGIIATLLMVTYTYFWELNALQISFLFAGPIITAVILITLCSESLNRRFEKQQLLRLSCALTIINLLWLTPLKLGGWLPENSNLVFALIYINWSIHMTMTILRVIAVQTLLADIVDEQELATGKRQEGAMFAAAFFSAKFISGFGYLIAGPFLDLIGLEPGLQPGEAPQQVIWGLGLIMGPGLAVTMLIPMWMSLKLRASHATHITVRKALAARAKAADTQ
ncbi:MAG: MFS transporter [Gammaproteobacteria bacterium]|nr:MFS transporter [Gammaproteobacteria bacterium]